MTKRSTRTWLVPRQDVARLLDCSVRQVSQLEAEGVLQPARRGRGGRASLFDAPACVRAYFEHLAGPAESGTERSARTRHYAAQARLSELKASQAEGALVSRDEVVAEGRAYTIAWKAALRKLPRHLTTLGLIGPEAEQHVLREIDDMLRQIAAWKVPADAADTKEAR